MKNLRTILVGIDFSEASSKALKQAARIAEWDGARLIVIHVLEREIGERLKSHLLLEEVEVVDRTRERLEEFTTKAVGSGRPVTCKIAVGHPFDRILRAAKAHSADLLVIGNQGLTQDKRETGVIAAMCLRELPVPVLLVRESQDSPFRKIVVCIDFSENSKRALEQGIHVAARDGSALHLLHVLRPTAELIADVGAFAELTPASPMTDYEETTRKHLAAFFKPFAAQTKDIPVSFNVMERVGISSAISDYLKETRADLVVLGTRGRTGLRKLLMGTTAERVLRHVPCSALAIKSEGGHGATSKSAHSGPSGA